MKKVIFESLAVLAITLGCALYCVTFNFSQGDSSDLYSDDNNISNNQFGSGDDDSDIQQNIKNASVFDFNSNSKNSTYKFWDNTINSSKYEPSFSESFVQAQKHDYAYNGAKNNSTFSPLDGYGYYSVPQSVYGYPNTDLDVFSYSNPRTAYVDSSYPAEYSEYNGYYEGARSDLFGMSFGLLGNLNYNLQTRDSTGNILPTWQYSFGINGPSNVSKVLPNDENNGGSTPAYAHGQKEKMPELFKTAYKNDFAYYTLWYLGVRESVTGTKAPDKNLRPTDDQMSNNPDSILKLINHSWDNAPSKFKDYTSDYYIEQPWIVNYNNHKYKVLTWIVPSQNTDYLVTEYVDSTDTTNIHMIVDKLFNRSGIYKDDTIYYNNGYLFANLMLPYWTTLDSPTFNRFWYYYINFGVFPTDSNFAEPESSSKINYNSFENPVFRSVFTAPNISSSIFSMLSSYGTSAYSGWDDPISNDVTVKYYRAKYASYIQKNNVVDEKFTKTNAAYKATPKDLKALSPIQIKSMPGSGTDTMDDWTVKYHFITFKSPSKNSSDNKKHPELNDEYNSYTPYNFYTAIVGYDQSQKSNYNENPYFLDIYTGIPGEQKPSTTGNNKNNTVDTKSENPTYSWTTQNIRTKTNDQKKVLGSYSIKFFPSANNNGILPKWAIIIISIFSSIIFLVLLYFIWSTYKIEKWKRKQVAIKTYKDRYFITDKDVKK